MRFWIRKDATKGERESPLSRHPTVHLSAPHLACGILFRRSGLRRNNPPSTRPARLYIRGDERQSGSSFFFRLSGKRCGGYAVSPGRSAYGNSIRHISVRKPHCGYTPTWTSRRAPTVAPPLSRHGRCDGRRPDSRRESRVAGSPQVLRFSDAWLPGHRAWRFHPPKKHKYLMVLDSW